MTMIFIEYWGLSLSIWKAIFIKYIMSDFLIIPKKRIKLPIVIKKLTMRQSSGSFLVMQKMDFYENDLIKL